ncbi:mucin-3/17 [Microdochium nivale]|nr:mucin-3/17 [Microdochium nivale]
MRPHLRALLLSATLTAAAKGVNAAYVSRCNGIGAIIASAAAPLTQAQAFCSKSYPVALATATEAAATRTVSVVAATTTSSETATATSTATFVLLDTTTVVTTTTQVVPTTVTTLTVTYPAVAPRWEAAPRPLERPVQPQAAVLASLTGRVRTAASSICACIQTRRTTTITMTPAAVTAPLTAMTTAATTTTTVVVVTSPSTTTSVTTTIVSSVATVTVAVATSRIPCSSWQDCRGTEADCLEDVLGNSYCANNINVVDFFLRCVDECTANDDCPGAADFCIPWQWLGHCASKGCASPHGTSSSFTVPRVSSNRRDQIRGVRRSGPGAVGVSEAGGWRLGKEA